MTRSNKQSKGSSGGTNDLGDDLGKRIQKNFLRRYCSLNSVYTVEQALLWAFSDVTPVRQVSVRSVALEDDALSWSKEFPPERIKSPGRHPQVEGGEQAIEIVADFDESNDVSAEISLGCVFEDEVDATNKKLRARLQNLLNLASGLNEKRKGQKAESPGSLTISSEINYEIPFNYEDDLQYLRSHFSQRYYEYRELGARLLGASEGIAEDRRGDFYCYFLLYRSGEQRLKYPGAEFYELTEAGRIHLNKHASRLPDKLKRNPTWAARGLLLEIMTESLRALEGSATPCFQIAWEPEPALEISGNSSEEVDEFLSFVNEELFPKVDHWVDWRLGGTESGGKRIENPSIQRRLLQFVLEQLPQGLSVGFASKVLVAGLPAVVDSKEARVRTYGQGDLNKMGYIYDVICAIERHFFWGSLDPWASNHCELTNEEISDSGGSIVSLAPIVSKGLPRGVFFVIERVYDTEGAGVGKEVKRVLAEDFCRSNAELASSLVGRAQERDFLARWRDELRSGTKGGDMSNRASKFVAENVSDILTVPFALERDAQEPAGPNASERDAQEPAGSNASERDAQEPAGSKTESMFSHFDIQFGAPGAEDHRGGELQVPITIETYSNRFVRHKYQQDTVVSDLLRFYEAHRKGWEVGHIDAISFLEHTFKNSREPVQEKIRKFERNIERIVREIEADANSASSLIKERLPSLNEVHQLRAMFELDYTTLLGIRHLFSASDFVGASCSWENFCGYLESSPADVVIERLGAPPDGEVDTRFCGLATELLRNLDKHQAGPERAWLRFDWCDGIMRVETKYASIQRKDAIGQFVGALFDRSVAHQGLSFVMRLVRQFGGKMDYWVGEEGFQCNRTVEIRPNVRLHHPAEFVLVEEEEVRGEWRGRDVEQLSFRLLIDELRGVVENWR